MAVDERHACRHTMWAKLVGLLVVQKRSQKFMVMKSEVFENEICGGFFGVKISCQLSPRKSVLTFLTKTSPHSSH